MNYLRQNAVDYQNRLTIENNLKVEINVAISKTSTTFPHRQTLRIVQHSRQAELLHASKNGQSKKDGNTEESGT